MTSAPLLARALRWRCSSIPRTAKASTHVGICGTFAASSTPTGMPGATSCSPATASPRQPVGRMCDARFSTCTLQPVRPWPGKRSTASADCTGSKEPSTAFCPMTGDESGNSDQCRSPRRCGRGPRKLRANCRADPSWPAPAATCARAGPRSPAASTTAAWRSTTTRPNVPCAVSRCGVHYAPLLQASGNIGSWFSGATRHGRPVRAIASITRSFCKSAARI